MRFYTTQFSAKRFTNSAPTPGYYYLREDWVATKPDGRLTRHFMSRQGLKKGTRIHVTDGSGCAILELPGSYSTNEAVYIHRDGHNDRLEPHEIVLAHDIDRLLSLLDAGDRDVFDHVQHIIKYEHATLHVLARLVDAGKITLDDVRSTYEAWEKED